jgi:hypothetical protein
VRGGSIIGNNCELGASDVCIRLHNATGIDVIGNKAYDGTSAAVFAVGDGTETQNTIQGNWNDGSGNTMYGASPVLPDATDFVIDLLTPLFQFPTGVLTTTGAVAPGSTTFSGLGTPANGRLIYCSDCTIANPCAGSGGGAIAKRLNGVWVCN